jgi:hypothetical protein
MLHTAGTKDDKAATGCLLILKPHGILHTLGVAIIQKNSRRRMLGIHLGASYLPQTGDEDTVGKLHIDLP